MLRELIALLKYAPSGGNVQPWVLKTSQRHTAVSISIFLDANIHFEKQHTDHSGYGALISLGALAYSIEYLCQDFGYRLVDKTIPSETKLERISILINLEACRPIKSERPSIFRHRFTDRRLYEKKPIPSELKQSLMGDHQASLHFFEGQHNLQSIDLIFRKLSLIRFQNKELFAELSHELKSDNSSLTGIPISNLGLSTMLSKVTRFQKKFPLRLPFAAAYSWPLNESISRPLANSAIVACLHIQGNRNNSWIRLGEEFMHVWLTITAAGVRLQPFGNTLTIANYYQDPNFFTFSAKQKKEIEHLHAKALDELKIETKEACLFFRLGYSKHGIQETPRKNILTIS